MSTEHRIVLADAHIFAQFESVGWWTCSKSEFNDERDFAMWGFSQANLSKAHKLIGDCPLVQAPLEYSVKQHSDNGWYIHRGDSVDVKVYGSQNEALRNLARSV